MTTVREHRRRIAILGSGNWGTAIAKLIGENVQGKPADYENEIKLWVHQELIDGKNLTDIINTERENVKYLPGIKLPSCIIADDDLISCARQADILIVCIPHIFLPKVLEKLKTAKEGVLKETTIAISLTKGIFFNKVHGPELVSAMIKNKLSLNHVAVLMGANVASDVARGDFVEATLACDTLDEKSVDYSLLKNLFQRESFQVEFASDVASVELFGALKNVIALGAGFCDGMSLGASTKAAVIRKGLYEMNLFCKTFSSYFEDDVVLKSCGVADLIATSFGGRNKLCAAEFARRFIQKIDTRGELSWIEIEQELLGGQHLQGLSTCDEVVALLRWLENPLNTSVIGESSNIANADESPHMIKTSLLSVVKSSSQLPKFPLIRQIHAIARDGADPRSLFQSWLN